MTAPFSIWKGGIKVGREGDREGGKCYGFIMEVITLEVGSRGFLNLQVFKDLFQTLTKCPRKNMWNLFKTICRITILNHMRIWTMRNIIT